MCKKILVLFAILIGTCSVYSSSSYAALPNVDPQDPTCNEDILVSMNARAWLEAQRETLQNENLIVKPDSVMEYSCFGSFLNELALEAKHMFSENRDAWDGSVGIINDSSLDEDLQVLVGTPLRNYLNENFGHDYLGGRWTGHDYNLANISSTDYTCEAMGTVWMYAKCVDYGIREEDNFRTFKQYVSYDPRTLPSPCASPDSRINTYEKNVFALGGTPGAATWRDEIATKFEDLYNNIGDLSGPGACGSTKPIRTGIIFWSEGNTINDATCLNPSCYYNGTNSCTNL